MQVRENSGEATTQGMLDSADFTIDISPEMFDMLSATIYTNRILAPIRELICNAYDVAGEKFKVNLPTQLMPIFSVRDFGTGLSSIEMGTLFTRYGGSNKRNSNDKIGGFGIGSKSPLAYCDQFTVTSYQNGLEIEYICYRSKGIPRNSKVIEKPTTEADGLKVAFAVKQEDIRRFEKEFLDFAMKLPFDVDVNVAYKRLARVEQIPGVYAVGDDLINRSSWNYVDPNIFAQIGIVSYDISKQVVAYRPAGKQYPYRQLFSRAQYFFEFPIGSLTIAPPREQLSMDAHTTSEIHKALDNFLDKYIKSIEAQLSSMPAVTTKDHYERFKKMSELCPNFGEFSTFSSVATNAITQLPQGQVHYSFTNKRLNLTGRVQKDPGHRYYESDPYALWQQFFTKIFSLNPDEAKFTYYNKRGDGLVKQKPPGINGSGLCDAEWDFSQKQRIHVLYAKNPVKGKASLRAQALRDIADYFERYDPQVVIEMDDPSKLEAFYRAYIEPIWPGAMQFVDLEQVQLPVKTPVVPGATTAAKPAAVLKFNHGWIDANVVIERPIDKDVVFFQSENRYVGTADHSLLNYIGLHAKRPIEFYALPKSRYASLSKQALAAGWLDGTTVDFSSFVDTQRILNIHNSRNVLTSFDYVNIRKFMGALSHKLSYGAALLLHDLKDAQPLASYELHGKLKYPALATYQVTKEEIENLWTGKEDWYKIYSQSHSAWTEDKIRQIFA